VPCRYDRSEEIGADARSDSEPTPQKIDYRLENGAAETKRRLNQQNPPQAVTRKVTSLPPKP
ncbi:MAG TPA: hypothetical protein VN325_16190, partial [Steroidobacteraceae bacterium]|nr:hypothetical protein [Steroidobacteraceae bacterium]